jgi:hypothetical protein
VVTVLAVVPAVILLRRAVRHLRRHPTATIAAGSNVVFLDEYRAKRTRLILAGHPLPTHTLHHHTDHSSVARAKALHPSSHHG